jgi:hypothetical protein
MTAEIAIVNRGAVTLAADSAMTLQVRGAKKIYSSTDKIFELSERDPIGLMIYNNLDFMGAPLDVLVKHFRNSRYCCGFAEMSAAAPAFFQYLTDEWMASDELQHRHAVRILRPIFQRVRRDFDRVIRQLVAEGKTISGTDIYQAFLRSVDARVARYEKLPPAECFTDTPESEIENYYRESIRDLIINVFEEEPLSEDDKKRLLYLGVLVLHRNSFSDGVSAQPRLKRHLAG